jgi:hypothetical protein
VIGFVFSAIFGLFFGAFFARRRRASSCVDWSGPPRKLSLTRRFLVYARAIDFKWAFGE